jgi:CheY-like chemotaxis protein
VQPKILIVDDHPVNIAIMKKILPHDCHLETAASGEETLDKVMSYQPDLILLDIMMPGIDGYETCRRIRSTPTLQHTKIIMVTAKAMPEERQQGFEAGADDYVIKPFEKQELLAKVYYCLGRSA